jgi:hypothetical protein
MARDMRHHHRHMAARTMQPQQADAGWNNNNGWDRHDSGFWPADAAAGAVGAAAGVAGAAVGTAGAIATAPFRTTDSYAYAPGPNGYNTYAYGPNGYYGDWNTYAARNGLVCRPGTWFKGDDGRQHLCQ